MRALFFVYLNILLFLCPTVAGAQYLKQIDRASLSPGTNRQGDSYSYDPSIDGSGRYVTFTSTADNFAASGVEQGKFHEHLYIRDVIAGTTTQIDVSPGGTTASPGQAFNTNLRTFSSSIDSHLSRNGQYVAFLSPAINLIDDGDSSSGVQRAYLKNLVTGELSKIPLATAGESGKSEYPTYLTVNADATVVVVMAIVGDVSDVDCAACAWELTVFDRTKNSTRLIDTGIRGNKFNPSISDDGRFIAFENQNGDFSQPRYSFVYDRELSQLITLNSGQSAISPSVSGDGSLVAYNDTSVVTSSIKVFDRSSGQESIISNGLDGAEARGISGFPSLSQDGRYVAFLSSADNLVADDFNGLDDIFVHDRSTGKTFLVSVQAECNSGFSTTELFNTGPPSISSDGRTIAFTVLERLTPSDSRDVSGHLLPGDTNSLDDVYVVHLDFDAQAPVFKKGLKPDAPLISVSCTGKDANIRLDPILLSKPSVQVAKGSSVIKKITQSVEIKKEGVRSELKRLIGKRNQIAAKNLAPGSYTAQVRAVAQYKDGKTVQTKPSSTTKFTITR